MHSRCRSFSFFVSAEISFFDRSTSPSAVLCFSEAIAFCFFEVASSLFAAFIMSSRLSFRREYACAASISCVTGVPGLKEALHAQQLCAGGVGAGCAANNEVNLGVPLLCATQYRDNSESGGSDQDVVWQGWIVAYNCKDLHTCLWDTPNSQFHVSRWQSGV